MGEIADAYKAAIASGLPLKSPRSDASYEQDFDDHWTKPSQRRRAKHKRAVTNFKKTWGDTHWGHNTCTDDLIEIAADYIYDGIIRGRDDNETLDVMPSMAGLCLSCQVSKATGEKWKRDPCTPEELQWRALCELLDLKIETAAYNAKRSNPEGPDPQIAVRVLASKFGVSDRVDVSHSVGEEMRRLNEFDKEEAKKLAELRLKQITNGPGDMKGCSDAGHIKEPSDSSSHCETPSGETVRSEPGNAVDVQGGTGQVCIDQEKGSS